MNSTDFERSVMRLRGLRDAMDRRDLSDSETREVVALCASLDAHWEPMREHFRQVLQELANARQQGAGA